MELTYLKNARKCDRELRPFEGVLGRKKYISTCDLYTDRYRIDFYLLCQKNKKNLDFEKANILQKQFTSVFTEEPPGEVPLV